MAPKTWRCLQAELAELKDRHLRLAADFENARRRSIKDREEAALFGHQNVVKDLLASVDNLERAIDHAREVGREAKGRRVRRRRRKPGRTARGRRTRAAGDPGGSHATRRRTDRGRGPALRSRTARGDGADPGCFGSCQHRGAGFPTRVSAAGAIVASGARSGFESAGGCRQEGGRLETGTRSSRVPALESRRGRRPNGQGHRNRPRHHELVRRADGGRRARHRRERRGCANDAVDGGVHGDRREAGRPDRQAPGRDEPRAHRLRGEAADRTQARVVRSRRSSARSPASESRRHRTATPGFASATSSRRPGDLGAGARRRCARPRRTTSANR